MTTATLSTAAAYFRQSSLGELVTYQKSIGMNPLEDEVLVECFNQMMSREFGNNATFFTAETFFSGVN